MKTLNMVFVIVASDKQEYENRKKRAQGHVKDAQDVVNQNARGRCPGVKITPTFQWMPEDDYRKISLGKLKTTYKGRQLGPKKDSFKLHEDAKALLKANRFPNVITVIMVPEIVYDLAPNGRVGKDGAGGITIGPNQYPETAQTHGVGIFIETGIEAQTHTLIHELGHFLLDSPTEEGTDDHSSDPKNIMWMEMSLSRRVIDPAQCRILLHKVDAYSD